jgi:GntR family transcriptional repressor for pyruvate dehydrogenase complex
MESLMGVQRQLIELIGPSPDSLVMPTRRRIFNYIVDHDEDKAVQEMERNIVALHKRYLATKPKSAPAPAPASPKLKRKLG